MEAQVIYRGRSRMQVTSLAGQSTMPRSRASLCLSRENIFR